MKFSTGLALATIFGLSQAATIQLTNNGQPINSGAVAIEQGPNGPIFKLNGVPINFRPAPETTTTTTEAPHEDDPSFLQKVGNGISSAWNNTVGKAFSWIG
ncbi:uncharacterized protein LOC142241434 [Haematobia irritans]|uniref:uncharacterized protein LOC142241434 n=1 Tax=Haematobia irritans TaxID=7368 RepID=UPI003F50A5D4